MRDGCDYVLLYAPPWDGPTRFSKHHLANYLADRRNRVLYVEAPLTPFGLKRGRMFFSQLRDTLHTPRQVANRLWVRRHFVPVPYHAASWLTSRRAANRLAQRLLAPVIRRDLIRLGMPAPILIAGLPHAADVVPLLRRRALVYHCADDYAHVSGFPETLSQVEGDLCRQSDLVITTSETLCEERRRFNPNTHWIPNAADIDHFSSPSAPPAELQKVPRPIIGFVGGLSEWVDVSLIADVARMEKTWSFVLVGPIGTDVSAIRDLTNVRLVGPRAYPELPGYLAAMDVGLIPFKQNRLTYHADPIKAYEYLAAGVPIVATDLPALRRLEHVLRLADSPRSFREQIQAALVEGRDARSTERRAEAGHHSWTSRFDMLDSLIRDTVACGS